MSQRPLVSAVIIFYQAERFLAEAIESVLAQTYRRWELVLVDDGSSDAGPRIAAEYAARDERIRCVGHPRGENRGMSASRNLGIASSTGDLIGFLDADDVWLPGKLEEQVRILAAHPHVAMVYGRTRWWYGWTGDPADAARDHLSDPGAPLDAVVPAGALIAPIVRGDVVPPYTCSALARREAVERIGGFEERFPGMYEDQVFFTKMLMHEPAYVAGACWDLYRQHDMSACAVGFRSGEAHPVDISPARGAFLEWLDGYAARHRPHDRAVRAALDRELGAYRFPTPPAEIVAVEYVAPPPAALRGFHIDFPAAGARTGGRMIEILGWVLGLAAPAVAVEIVSEGRVVTRAAVGDPRPDLEAAFPDVPEAATAGFRTRVSFTGTAPLAFELRAVLRTQQRVRLADVRARRCWPEASLARGAALVTVVVTICDPQDDLAGALESALSQTYPHVEVVVANAGVDAGALDGARRRAGVRVLGERRSGVVAARDAALATSEGAFVAFIDARERLLPGALETGLRELAAHPAVAFVQGTSDGGGRPHAPLQHAGRLGACLFRRVLLGSRAPTEADAAGGGRQLPCHRHAAVVLGDGARLRTLARTVARVRPATRPRAVVLLYHRVGPVVSDPWGLSVTPERFAEHLDVLRRSYVPMALGDIADALDGSLVDRSVAVTFDDGYADNLHVAKPLLVAQGVPATVFVSTGPLGGDQELWWDELDRILLQPGRLPASLRIRRGGAVEKFDLGENRLYTAAEARAHRGWRAHAVPPTARHALYVRLYQLLAPFDDAERRAALRELAEWAAVDDAPRSSHRPLTPAEVRELHAPSLIDIGAHTVTHPRLSALPPSAQREEIGASKVTLEGLLRAPVKSFAYPHGTAADYDRNTIALVHDANFAYACSAIEAAVVEGADRLAVPRLMVEDWDGDELARRIEALSAPDARR